MMLYDAGLYARLSVAQDVDDLLSAEVQFEITEEYAKRQKDIVVRKRYEDLGTSGTDFKREGFLELLSDIRAGSINCVIVKDFSRFGRNYVETGNFIEKIFPCMGVRFIAVTDGYDSLYADQGENMVMGLKSIVNELYARDCSIRVRSAIRTRRQKGGYTGGIPPYGFQIARIDGVRKLIPDNSSKEIVCVLYQMFAGGSSLNGVIQWLYEHHIQTPGRCRTTRLLQSELTAPVLKWSRSTLKTILQNPVYMEKTLIPEDLFLCAVKRLEENQRLTNQKRLQGRAQKEEPDAFHHRIFCGSCGAALLREAYCKKGREGVVKHYFYYCCPNAKSPQGCSLKRITQKRIEAIWDEVLQREFRLHSLCGDDVMDMIRQEASHHEKKLTAQSSQMQKQQLAMLNAYHRLGESEQEKGKEDYTETQLNPITGHYQEWKEEEKRRNRRVDAITTWKDETMQRLKQSNYVPALLGRLVLYETGRAEIVLNYRR